jgi:energy-converting hydrogenase A subunit P
MVLHLDIARCIRAKSRFSECTKCVDVAGEHLHLSDNLPTFAKGVGVEASACVGVCPNEAFSLSEFSTTEFFFSFLESKVRLISSKLNIPCLSVLSVEHLIALALASKEPITLDLHSYEQGTPLYEEIERRMEEANFILSSFTKKELLSNVDPLGDRFSQEDATTQEPSRRDFLQSASLKGALKHKRTFDEAVEADELKRFDLDKEVIEKIRSKALPDKRKILLTTLKHANAPESFEVLPEEEVSFVSQKFVDSSCTNCQICYRICPTGALSSDHKFSLIHFDAMLCLKCRLCHDVCEPDAIKLQEGFEIQEFFEPRRRTLATFTIKRCNECGNYFTYEGGEVTCPRCMVEEEEAIFLHANALQMQKRLEEE